MSGAPRVSVLLPTWNGERHLARLLPALATQQIAGAVELVALDSESSDRTRELLAAAGARIESIAQREFHHGSARNRLAGLARGELLVFLSQDALPEGPRFLHELVAPFHAARVAGVSARILPHDDDDPLTRRTALAAPEAGERVSAGSVVFNDVASAIRADVLRTIPFPDLDFGEDLAWAKLALAANHEIVFAPRAIVRHAHRYGLGSAFARNQIDARFRREQFGERVRPSLWSVAKGIAYEVHSDVRFVSAHGGAWHLLRSPFLRSAQVLGQYSGSRG